MNQDRLWAPWREGYLRLKKKPKCIFCNCLKKGKHDYLVFKSKYSFAVLNIFPYNNGHMLISPARHVRDIAQLKEAEALDLFKSLVKSKQLLEKTLKPDGYNIGINTSATAGAGVAGHMHIHIVPRWRGDTNFMSSVYNTKVISQSLDALLKKLKHAQATRN